MNCIDFLESWHYRQPNTTQPTNTFLRGRLADPSGLMKAGTTLAWLPWKRATYRETALRSRLYRPDFGFLMGSDRTFTGLPRASGRRDKSGGRHSSRHEQLTAGLDRLQRGPGSVAFSMPEARLQQRGRRTAHLPAGARRRIRPRPVDALAGLRPEQAPGKRAALNLPPRYRLRVTIGRAYRGPLCCFG